MLSKEEKKIRVMIVDDSRVSRKLYQSILAAYPEFEICCFASNGKEAVEMAASFKPDVISMDIEMPVMNGLDATRIIMQEHPMPIVIVSSLYRTDEIQLAMRVLEAGAVGIIVKPYGPGNPSHEKEAKSYARMIRTMSEVKVVRRRSFGNKSSSESVTVDPSQQKNPQRAELVVIGASAGGPEAVKTVISAFDRNFQLPVLIVQHIDPHFAEGYCQWLSGHTSMLIKIASENEVLSPGTVYLSAGGKHLKVLGKNRVGSVDGVAINGHKPSVELLFDSARDHYGGNLIAIMLSGMGNDGAAAMKRLFDSGALCLVQNAASCLVFGMPGEAIKLGAASNVLHPAEISNEVLKNLKKIAL